MWLSGGPLQKIPFQCYGVTPSDAISSRTRCTRGRNQTPDELPFSMEYGLIENGLLYIVICYSVHAQMNGPIAAHRSNGPIAAHRSNGPIAAHGTNGPIAAHRLNRPIAAHISLIRSNFTRCLYTTF